MAVKSNTTWRRTSLIALAVAALSLPSMVQAAPEREGGWRDRTAREDGAPRHQRQAPPQAQQQQQPPQQQPQQAPRTWSPPPQAQGEARAAPQSRWNGGEDRRGGDNGRRQGWNGGNREENRGWATRAPQASQRAQDQQPVQAGRNWRERTERAGDEDRRPDRTARSGDWRGRGNRQDDQGRTWQGSRQGDARGEATVRHRDGAPVWQGRDQRRDGDWRSRVQRTDRDYDRSYWGSRNWSNHWDGSRRHRWSGWNNNWDWTWGSSYNRWNTRWRGNSRYDWYGWRNYHPSYFQVGYYYSPYRGYSYRRLSIGYFLDALFFGQDYWIADPWYYHLPEAYGPYRWVRYYDDAVLVNIYTGEVSDVIYDFFW